LEPGERVRVTVQLDLRHEPAFVGKLKLDADAIALTTGLRLGVVLADVEVTAHR
jgi:hypothetical protein